MTTISKSVEEKAIEDTQRVAEEAKSIKDKHDALKLYNKLDNNNR